MTDSLGAIFARWLAPYVADELGRESQGVNPKAFTAEHCRELARELGVNSLHRSRDFFNKLDAEGSVDSLSMATHIGVGTPRNIPSAVTTPVKRVAKRLGFGFPWDEEENAENARSGVIEMESPGGWSKRFARRPSGAFPPKPA